jgi:predicted HD phosphohydrolase
MRVQKVSFAYMSEGTAEDFQLCAADIENDARALPDRMLQAVAALDDPSGCLQVTRLEHSLQSATRAYDIGDQRAPYSHGELVAAVLRPFVSDRICWIIEHHALFQSYYYAHLAGGDRYARDRFNDHPYYADCVEFCERYDQNCFDPDFQSRPLQFFEPIVRSVFARSPRMVDMAGVSAGGAG